MSDCRYLVADRDWRYTNNSIARSHTSKARISYFSIFGVKPVILEPQTGEIIEGNGVSGVLAMETPWPGQMRTVYGDHKRF